MSYNTHLKFNHDLLLVLGEALGAIGSADVISLLEEYAKDPVIEVYIPSI